MKPSPAFVQSTFDFAIREINALETRIIKAEDDADAMLWEQAGQVVAQLEAGLSQRKLAAQWINARTGAPYDQKHVFFVKEVWKKFEELTPQNRPRFRDAYNDIANASTAHVSHNSGNNEWYTPAEYVDAVRQVLGVIDLDPASTRRANDVVGAKRFFSVEDDGLAQRWRGRVFMNPPYAQPLIAQFAEKLATSVKAGDVPAAIALVNNATETDWFQTLSDVACAFCFPTGRISFWNPDQESATPLQGQALLYIGDGRDAFQKAFAGFGVVLFKLEP